MNNNSIFKKVVIAQNLKHFEIQEVFELGKCKLTGSRIRALMAGSRNKNHEKMSEELLTAFLDGLIQYNRGNKDEAQLPRHVENYIIGQIDAGNLAALEEIACLVEDGLDHLREQPE